MQLNLLHALKAHFINANYRLHALSVVKKRLTATLLRKSAKIALKNLRNSLTVSASTVKLILANHVWALKVAS